jgi:hypothetical protein
MPTLAGVAGRRDNGDVPTKTGDIGVANWGASVELQKLKIKVFQRRA